MIESHFPGLKFTIFVSMHLNYAIIGREGGENDVGRCWNSKIADWYPYQSTSGKLVVWDSKRRALKSPIPFINKNNTNPTNYH